MVRFQNIDPEMNKECCYVSRSIELSLCDGGNISICLLMSLSGGDQMTSLWNNIINMAKERKLSPEKVIHYLLGGVTFYTGWRLT